MKNGLDSCQDVPASDEQDIEKKWREFRNTTYSTAVIAIGVVQRKHQDWFNENDQEMQVLLNEAHRKFIMDKTSPTKKTAYLQPKRDVQKAFRVMKNQWWEDKAGSKMSLLSTIRRPSLMALRIFMVSKLMNPAEYSKVMVQHYSQTQCSCRSYRGTTEMIFEYRQLQEKCLEQNIPLYTVLVDLNKAFDTISREWLWKLLHYVGCPEKLIVSIRSFHDVMRGRVFGSGKFSEQFTIANCAKKGRVLAPTLFGIVFQFMLQYAFGYLDREVYLKVRAHGGVFNLRRFSAHTNITQPVKSDLLFSDDCALSTRSQNDIQGIVDRFADAAKNFGLTISLKKAEVLFQPCPKDIHCDPEATIDGTKLTSL